ncbi:MAG: FGGY family carbohydrate kinase [Spirochaetaceae bacterium]|nr:FGGY family carbohydrate kinase [Spirochaetaceae bacterium]
MSYLVALDAGASEVKVSIFDRAGAEVANARRDCPSEAPQPGWAECPPEVLTRWPLDVLREALETSGVPLDEVAAVGVTGSRATVLPVGRDGEPCGSAIFWYDRRASGAADELGLRLDGPDRFQQLTGIPLDATPSVAKIMWLRRHQSRIFDAAALFAIPQSAVLNALTGSGWSCDASYGSYVGLMDLETRRWNDELLAASGISAAALPELVAPGTVTGTIGATAAAATGLPRSVKVVASGSDSACFKIGAGIEGTGVASIYIGTAGVVGVITNRPVRDPRLTCCPSALPGYWDTEGLLLSAGSAYRWLRDLLNVARPDGGTRSFGDLDALAAEAPPGSDGLLVVPHLAGSGTPLWRADASGVVSGLRLSHSLSSLARAVLEGVAYAQRHALDAVAEHVSPLSRLRFTGGGAASALWAQIIADVTGIPVSVPASRESTALGAALIAGVAAGIYSDHRCAIAAAAGPERQFQPDAVAHETYVAGYRSYVEVAER